MNQYEHFFAQSYEDAWNDYDYSCKVSQTPHWDWIILTAANQKQAGTYRYQIRERQQENCLPLNTNFAVIPDLNDERIGSGGATLSVLSFLSEKVGWENVCRQKVLLIHSGGDSKRIPQYSVCGKLFAPVPRELPDGRVSSLFDEMLIAASGIPARTSPGLMIFPSDTELLFNPLQMDLLSCDAAGISMKAPVTVGKDHGVFVPSGNCSDHRNQDVSLFLHKQSVRTLRELHAVDSADQVNIDTGCIWLGTKVVDALLSLISRDGAVSPERLKKFANKTVCLNFYADFVYPTALDGTLEEYQKEAPENGYTEALTECRNEIWKALHDFRLSLVKLVPAKYIHFGMTDEMYDLYVKDIENYRFLGWTRSVLASRKTYATVINSRVDNGAEVSTDCYIENSRIGRNVKTGHGTVLSNVSLENCQIPDDVVLSGAKLSNEKYVCRIYSKTDNPKNSRDGAFLGHSIDELISCTGISDADIWDEDIASIWNAKIYSAEKTPEAAAEAALLLYRILQGKATGQEIDNWKKAEKYSLKSSFADAANEEMFEEQKTLSREIHLTSFLNQLRTGVPMNSAIGALLAGFSDISDDEFAKLLSFAENSGFPDQMRTYLALAEFSKKLGRPICGHDSEYYEDRAYESIEKNIIDATFAKHPFRWDNPGFRSDEVRIDLPVRVNFCGSPSDAAPYCLEHGGTMLDGTLLLKGKKPIAVTAKKLSEPKIILASRDQGCIQTFDCLEDLLNCGNPFDSFALHKAVLSATGLLGQPGSPKTMEEFYKCFGGGLSLTTEVDIPKGSGLGTSSIIAAAAVKAVNSIFGQAVDNQTIYAQVFLTEQLMGTGGGWQDQVGGLTPGIKYFEADPGIYQKIRVDTLALSAETMAELNDRFALIFSGQRRLARNVLREEMNQCIKNDPAALDAVSKIQEYCALMRFYLLKGNITSFAEHISKQSELVKLLDNGASNTCIEYIFDVIDDLIDGKCICGAGGGGFLQVVLKKGVTKQQLVDRINSEFIDCGVEVWDCELI